MDFVCRYGGDEFAVICAGSRLHEAAAAAERVRQSLAATPLRLSDHDIPLTLSVGVAEVGDSEIAEGLVQRADEALYAAKHAGRNRVHKHDGQQCLPSSPA
jgi:diguanylate cyclase (GGDEF)-like protein